MNNIKLELLPALFPTELMQYFIITGFETKLFDDISKDHYIIDFEEINDIPNGYPSEEYESKGFMDSALIQDFPIRGKGVFLRIKKRRWRHKKTDVNIRRDFSFIAASSKFTSELSDFLKGAGGYATRYHNEYSELLRDRRSETPPSL